MNSPDIWQPSMPLQRPVVGQQVDLFPPPPWMLDENWHTQPTHMTRFRVVEWRGNTAYMSDNSSFRWSDLLGFLL